MSEVRFFDFCRSLEPYSRDLGHLTFAQVPVLALMRRVKPFDQRIDRFARDEREVAFTLALADVEGERPVLSRIAKVQLIFRADIGTSESRSRHGSFCAFVEFEPQCFESHEVRRIG